MNEYFQKIISWTKHVFVHASPMDYARKGIRPARDWQWVLGIAAILFLLFGMVSYYFYYRLDEGTLFAVPDDTTQAEVTINTSLLSKIVSEMNARQSQFLIIQSEKTPSLDPSL